MMHGHRKPKQSVRFSTLLYHVLRVQVKSRNLRWPKHPHGQQESPLTEQHDDGPLWSWLWTERLFFPKKYSRCRRARRCDTLYKPHQGGDKANYCKRKLMFTCRGNLNTCPFILNHSLAGVVTFKIRINVTTRQYQMRKMNTCR